MTNVLSIFVKCVCVKFLCCCASVLQCQPRWRPIANHLLNKRCYSEFHAFTDNLPTTKKFSIELVLVCEIQKMDVSSCLQILGGWLECLCMYNRSSLGFL